MYMKMCASVSNNTIHLFTKDSRSNIYLDVPWGYEVKYYKNIFTSLYNSVRPTQKDVCENQCTVNFNYSVVLDQLMPCIYETGEEADTAPLFNSEYPNKLYMSRLEQLGVVLVSTQPD